MALDVARIQAICFDVDGTLSDTDDQWIAAWELHLQSLRWLFPRGEVRPFARWAIMCAETPGNLISHWLDHAGLDDRLGRLYSYLCQREIGRKPGKFWLIQGVQAMLGALHLHYPLAVVSARDRAGTTAFLSQYELSGFFHTIATAGSCRHTKPFPDPILWAAGQMGVAPENCLMVGDTAVDIIAGRAAGAQTVGVLCGFGHEPDLRRAGADLILPCTSNLENVLMPALTNNANL